MFVLLFIYLGSSDLQKASYKWQQQSMYKCISNDSYMMYDVTHIDNYMLTFSKVDK